MSHAKFVWHNDFDELILKLDALMNSLDECLQTNQRQNHEQMLGKK
jgi:hypothetical protein